MSTAETTAPQTRNVVHEVVHLDSLGHVYQRPPLDQYLRLLWARRHFIRADARGRVISGARGMVLGLGWLVLRPILDGAAYYVIFGLVLQTSRGIDNFLGYLLIGVFLFHYTTRCLNSGAQSLIGGRNLLRAFTFPRASLPIAAVVRETITTIPVIAVMFVLILALPPEESITWRWLLFPAVLVMQVAFNLGLALIAARLTARIPDLSHLIAVFARFWLYASAVFFSYERFNRFPEAIAVIKNNPMFIVLDMSRDLLLYATMPDPSSWLKLLVWSTVMLVGGMWFFWRAEERYGSL